MLIIPIPDYRFSFGNISLESCFLEHFAEIVDIRFNMIHTPTMNNYIISIAAITS